MSAIRFSFRAGRAARNLALFFCAAVCANYPLRGGVTADGMPTPDGTSTATAATTEEEATDYKNWIELGIGGLIINGDAAQFKQEHRMSGDVYGGIQDLHYEHSVSEKATFSIDGHAIWDNNDYDVKLDLSEPNVGYIRGGFNEFRSWYDGNGGFFPPHGTSFPPAFSEMHIDRGEGWVEFGIRLPDWPEITVHYSHQFRDGQKDSTIWGDTGLTGIAVNPTRKIVPAYRDIDETRDILSVDATKTFGNTDIGLGMRLEHDKNDDRLQFERNPAQANQRFFTQREGNTVDDFSGHISSETRFTDSFWFTAAYSYSTLNSDLTGTRIVGTHYNSLFGQAPQFTDSGFLNLAGTSQVDEHVFNANLFWVPLKDLNVIVGFRYTHEDTESDSTFLATTTSNVASIPKSADTSDDLNNVAETFELRYTHIENWLFYAEGEWEEEFGDVHEHEVGGVLVGGVPVSSDQGAMNKDTALFGQKYTIGATWYAMTRLNLAMQYYYKAADYDNDFHSELATPTSVPAVLGSERNQRLIGQDWTTNDFNIRITARPKIPTKLGTLSLVTRYDFVQSAIAGKWAISPAGTPPVVPPAPPAIPTGTFLNEEQTGLLTNHVISESATWNPLARLYLQATASYVLNQTETPASKINLIPNTSVTVGNFRDDYWTVTSGAGYLLDDKTDLHTEYSYYRANDYVKNSRVALPYGMGATEHSLSASISRQLAKNVRLTLKYAYFNYTDETFGDHNNYEAHSVFSSLQFRF